MQDNFFKDDFLKDLERIYGVLWSRAQGVLWFKSKARKKEMVEKKENCLKPSQAMLMFETEHIWFFLQKGLLFFSLCIF